MENVIKVLQERGFIEALTSEEVIKLVEKPAKVYCGFDPTADSLHLGSMVPIMGLAWFQRFGHTPVALVGGTTGLIGDPSGKTSERQLLDETVIRHNERGIQANLATILGTKNALFLNNYDWYKDFSIIRFLRDVGKFFRVGVMLGKDSVRARMESEEGMSYTEFTYQLLQGYDFLYLYDTHGVTIQLGGSDQWGNITAGVDLIRKTRSKSSYGVTFPLLVSSDGSKFGKSEKGAIWLSSEKLSCYEFYQYLVRVPDADVIKLLCLLTFVGMDEIRALEKEMKKEGYVPNTAQKRLAAEVTRIVHGERGLAEALAATEAARPGQETVLDVDTLLALASTLPSYTIPKQEVLNMRLLDLFVKSGLQDSVGQARRLIQGGGAYINNEKTLDENKFIHASDLIGGRLILLSVGKKNKMIIYTN